MRNLLNFIIRYFSWIVFLFYVVISCTLLFQNNSYQHHVFLTSANAVTSWVYGGVSNITSYFHLRDINEDLQVRNAHLEMEVISLKKSLNDYKLKESADSMKVDSVLSDFSIIMAHVINNSISKPFNYITINKGSADGVREEMGVVDQNGVIGIVNVVGKHSARIISLLNPNFRLSCKLKNSDFFGSLVWDGDDPTVATLEELPRHVVFHKGDTVVTSGYSAVFPEGLIVGKIITEQTENKENFFSLKVKLTSDFTQLSTVRVVENKNKEELNSLENKDKKEDKQ